MARINESNPRIFFLSVIATFISFSTLYLTELRNAELQLLPSQAAWLAMDRNGSREVIALPFTVSNHGTRTGAVRDLLLRVTDSAGRSREFHAAWFGSRPTQDNLPFSPIAVEGKSSTAHAILFYPLRAEQPLIAASGDYTIELTYMIEVGPSVIDFSTRYLREMQEMFDTSEPQPVVHAYEAVTSYSRDVFTLRLKQFSRPDLENGRLIRMAPPAWDNF